MTTSPLSPGLGARNRTRRWKGVVFATLAGAATLVGLVALVLLLGDVVRDGLPRLGVDFLRGRPSRFPERAGIAVAVAGTFWVMTLTAVLAFPVALGAAIYLEEYAPDTWLVRATRTNIANLAGVPSVVYGILGLAVFVRALGLGRSVLAGALTLTLLVLPIMVLAAQEALRAVPRSIRDAAFALGATRWQVVRHQVLPAAMPGILTGTILALARAVGETAPLILVGAVGFIAFAPTGLSDQFTVLPVQIFDWVRRPQPEFRELAAAAILVLLFLLVALNAVAIVLRQRFGVRR